MTQHTHRADAVGAYRDPNAHHGRSMAPWIIGAILLLLAILALLWAMGTFSNDEVDRGVVPVQDNVPAARTGSGTTD